MDKRDITLLIVDDDKICLDAVVSIAKAAYGSLKVHSFKSSLDALTCYAENPFIYDAVILDMVMPEMDGLTLASKIMPINPHEKIIVLSAYNISKMLTMPEAEFVEYFINKSELDFYGGRGQQLLKYHINRCIRQKELERAKENLAKIEKDEVLSQKKSLEEQLLQSQKMEALGTLAGGIAHDLNNFLTVISGNAQIVLMKAEENSPLKKHLEEISKATDRASQIINRLLILSRKKSSEMKPVNLNKVIQNLFTLLKRTIGEDIVLKEELLAEPGNIMGDEAQLEQAILNIVVNAKDALPCGGEITLKTYSRKIEECERKCLNVPKGVSNCVLLEISDTGSGMDEKTKNRIFEPFFTTKESGKGTGLGLSTVYSIVSQLSGSIEVSSSPGAGTTFYICFPESSESGREHLSPPIESLKRTNHSMKVLIVEDEPAVSDILARMLEEMGYSVIKALDGESGLKIFSENPEGIDLLITDVKMPNMNGVELVKKIKTIKQDIKVIFISGHIFEALDPVLKDHIFITKPISINQLSEALSIVCGSH